MDERVNLPALTAALGTGFYRYWHVPHPDATLDEQQTRRADRSVIGPAAMALLSAVAWCAGQVGTPLLLEQPVGTAPEALPWPAQVLVVLGLLGMAVAAAWWLGAAPVRVRVAHGVTVGYVVRVPDDPEGCAEPLHAAVTELGNALRDLDEDRPLAERAFAV
ncbi:MAG: hypothetical protein M3211_09200, partial [Actinomycetota bacterium]|nr:hypothetical protein [Actinomycetota bacterium]